MYYRRAAVSLILILILAWGIYDCDLDLNYTNYYHFGLILELIKIMVLTFDKLDKITAETKKNLSRTQDRKKGQTKLDTSLDRTKFATNKIY